MPPTWSTVAPVGFEDFADPDWLRCMKRLGCSSAQLYRNQRGNDASHDGPVTTQQMLDYLAEADLPCDSLHGVYGNALDPSDPDEQARRKTLDALRREGELAIQLGGPLVVVHCSGRIPDTATCTESHRRERWDQLRRSVETLARAGEDLGVVYALENLPPYHWIGWDVGRLAALVEEFGHPQIGLCFDVAHARLAGDELAAIHQAGENIRYLHLCDNHGLKDDHLLPFLGSTPWSAVAQALRQARYGGILMLEVFHDLPELRDYLAEGWVKKLAGLLDEISG